MTPLIHSSPADVHRESSGRSERSRRDRATAQSAISRRCTVLLWSLLLVPVGHAQATDIVAEPGPSAAPTVAEALPDELRRPAPEQLEAAYQFALGKLLADESEFEQALMAYQRVVELAPDEPYGWIEIAKLNSYLSQISRTRQQQVSYLEGALDHIERARELAPDNIDVLTLYAQTNMRLGSERPASLALAEGAYERLNELQPDNPATLTALGQIYLWNQEGEKAVDVLTEAARFHSTNRVIQSMLVEALLGTGKAEDAEKALETMITLEPTNLEHRLRLAELRSDRGDHAAAVEVLEGAPEDDWLGGARIRRLLAREYHLAGRHEDALRTLDAYEASQGGVSQPTVAVNEGRQRLRTAVLSALLRFDEAIEVFRPIAGAEGDPARALQDALLLSRLYERVGRFDEAIDVLQAHVATLSEDDTAGIQMSLAIAGALERGGRAEEALSSLAALGETGDARTRAVAAQGQSEILENLRRYDEASQVLEQAADELSRLGSQDLAQAVRLRQAIVESDAENWDRALEITEGLLSIEESEIKAAAVRLRIAALSGSGRVDEALALVDQGDEDARARLAKRAEILFDHDRRSEAIELIGNLGAGGEPDDTFFASQLFQRHNEYGQAAALLQKLADSQPENIRVLFALGAAQERSGSLDLAAETFLRLLEKSPDHAPTLNYLGYMWAEQGVHLERALEMIRVAVSQEPDNGAYVDSLGWVYFQLGRYEEALPHLEWAARLEPSDPAVFEHLGDLYRALHRPEPARDAYRRALVLDPEGEESESIRGRLESLGGEAPASPEVSSGT